MTTSVTGPPGGLRIHVRLPGGFAAVDDELSAGRERRFVARKERHHVRDLYRVTRAALGNVREPFRVDALDHAGVDVAGVDRIGTDAVGGELYGDRFGRAANAELGGVVARHTGEALEAGGRRDIDDRA